MKSSCSTCSSGACGGEVRGVPARGPKGMRARADWKLRCAARVGLALATGCASDEKGPEETADTEESSHVSGALRRYRTFYMAWFWEFDEDDSVIQCETSSSNPEDRCDGTTVDETSGDSPDVYSFASEEATDLRASCSALYDCIRDTLRIATGVAPSCGTSPVGMEGRW